MNPFKRAASDLTKYLNEFPYSTEPVEKSFIVAITLLSVADKIPELEELKERITSYYEED